MKRFLVAAAAVGLAIAAITSASAQEKLKVGFIYVGPVGDMGYSYQHDVGRKEIEAKFKDKIDTSFLENVNEGPDAERSIEQLVRTGHKLIFTTSFGFMDATAKVAKKYPNVMFEHATGYKRDKNLATYSGRFYEGRYIQGIIAAKMSKSGTLGYIGSFPIPEVVSGINATILGAQSVRPDIKVKIIWVNSWYDPGKEAAAARALADQGADVLMQHTDSAAAMQFANERGIYAFGQDSDMIKFGPKSQLTAIVENWGPYYIDRVQLALDKKWTSSDFCGGADRRVRLDRHLRRRRDRDLLRRHRGGEPAGREPERGRDPGRRPAAGPQRRLLERLRRPGARDPDRPVRAGRRQPGRRRPG